MDNTEITETKQPELIANGMRSISRAGFTHTAMQAHLNEHLKHAESRRKR
jgi:hypothetical protein